MILACFSLPSYAREDTKLEEKIKEILLGSPEILMEAQKSLMEDMSQKFDDQQNKNIQSVLHNHRGILEQHKASALGHGPKKVFAFVSPYCPHCQDLLNDFFALLETDPSYKVSLIWATRKEDKGELIAARALLAAHEFGKFKEFFQAMSDKVNRLERKDALEIAEHIGLNPHAFKEKMESKAIEEQLKEMRALAEKFSLSGFPTLIYEKETRPGEYGVIEGRPKNNSLATELRQ